MNSKKLSMNRLHELDALRGIALFGILLVNIFIFHAPYSYYGEFYGNFTETQGIVVEAVVNFASGKFLFIFAFLFGYGMAIQKQLTGVAFNAYHTKRMLVLLLFGILHIILFWFGDILASYALLGLLMLLFTRLSNKFILFLGVFFLLFRPLYYLVIVGFHLPLVEMGKPAELNEFILTFQEGSFYEIFLLRMKEFYAFIPENLVWFFPKTLGLFLVGFYCRNKNFTKHIQQNRAKYLLVFVSLILLSVAWIYIKPDFFAKFDLEASPIMRPVLIAINVIFETIHGMAYVIGFIMLFQYSRVVSKLFETTGRMALTNYILQSLFCVAIFYSYGLGMFASLLPTDLLCISITIFGFNIYFSKWYLKNHHHGPLEYLWRKIIMKITMSNKK